MSASIKEEFTLGMFDLNRSSYKSEGGKLKVIKGAMVVLREFINQGLYILEGIAIIGVAAVVNSND